MTLEEIRVLPVVVLKTLDETVPTLSALREGGIPAAEITFRTPCAPDALRLAVRTFPEMLVGAGTVINAAQAKAAEVRGLARTFGRRGRRLHEGRRALCPRLRHPNRDHAGARPRHYHR